MASVFISAVTTGAIICARSGHSRSITVSIFSSDGFTGDVALDVSGGGFTVSGVLTITYPGTANYNICLNGDGTVNVGDIPTVASFTLNPVAGTFTGGAVTRNFYEQRPLVADFQLPHSPPLSGPGEDVPNSGIWYRDPRPQPFERRQRRGQIWPR